MNLERIRSQLLEERENLLTHSEDARTSREAVALDQQSVGRLSRMDAIQLQAMALASERRRQIRIKRVEAALKRIESGEFGYCARCDEPILEKRLMADPTTPSCTACANSGVAP